MGKLGSIKEVSASVQATSITNIPVEYLHPLKNHPFELYCGERYEDMVESIKQNGILQPILVRYLSEDKYEIIAGHNRWNCGKAAGLKTVPCNILHNLSDEEAMKIAVITNFHQRGFNDLAISEQALVLSQEYKELFSQGKRTDIEEAIKAETGMTSSQIETKLRSDEKLGHEYGMSRATVHRLMRINKLIPELKADVDSGKLSVDAAVELSYIDADKQKAIKSNTQKKISKRTACELREASSKQELESDDIKNIVSSDACKKPRKITLTPHIIETYFSPTMSKDGVMSTIEEALQAYFDKREDDSND